MCPQWVTCTACCWSLLSNPVGHAGHPDWATRGPWKPKEMAWSLKENRKCGVDILSGCCTLRGPFAISSTVLCYLMTGVDSKKCILKQFWYWTRLLFPGFVLWHSWWLKPPDKQLGVKASSCHLPGVKSKASTKFIEGIEEHLDGWDLVNELSQRMAEVYEIMEANLGTPLHSTFDTVAIIGCLIDFWSFGQAQPSSCTPSLSD
jgi:hypothetical protein